MTHYLTKEGLKEIEEELKHLNEVAIPEILEAINREMQQGDISENAALDSAREEHDKMLARQSEIEEILSSYEIIDESKSKGAVAIGSTVKVKYLSNNDEYKLKIVGSSESDALQNKISNESPLAQAIIGKKKGDTAKFKIKPSDKSSIEVKVIEIGK